jgi:hypothetical protein
VTIDRTQQLSHDEIDLKIATDSAMDAAGGQSRMMRAGVAVQSVLSDACSRNTRVFLRIDQVAAIENHGTGRAGHPHITRALARLQGFVLVPAGDAGDEESIPMLLGQLAAEFGDVFKAMAARVETSAPMSVRDHEDTSREIDQLADAVAALRHAHAANRPGSPPG